MKRAAILLALIVTLLSAAAIGLHGCGKTNSLAAIVITPVSPELASGTSLQLTVTAIFTSGMTVSPWNVVTWQTSDDTIVKVDTAGRITAVNLGSAVITAIDMGHPSITRSVTAIVRDLQSIDIVPSSATISISGATDPLTVQFQANGTYLVASSPAVTVTEDVTSAVLWSSSVPTIAVISSVTPTPGLASAAQGASPGTVTIMATKLSGTTIMGTATLMVVP
jgi:hypothetical protein